MSLCHGAQLLFQISSTILKWSGWVTWLLNYQTVFRIDDDFIFNCSGSFLNGLPLCLVKVFPDIPDSLCGV